MRHARNTCGAAVVLTAAMISTGCSTGSDPVAAPKHSPTSTAAPTAAPMAAPTPKPMAGINGPLEPGSWVVPFWGENSDSLPRAVVDVPEGYGSPGGWVVDRGADGHPDEYGSVSFWTVQGVVRDPCEGLTTFDPGPGVDDLAKALHTQPGVTATPSRPISVDGHAGLYLEVAAPADDSAIVGCHSSEYHLWSTDAGDYYGAEIAGTVSRLWILDVEGTRVVMVADSTPREDAVETAEVLGIAASAHFVGPAEPGPAAG